MGAFPAVVALSAAPPAAVSVAKFDVDPAEPFEVAAPLEDPVPPVPPVVAAAEEEELLEGGEEEMGPPGFVLGVAEEALEEGGVEEGAEEGEEEEEQLAGSAEGREVTPAGRQMPRAKLRVASMSEGLGQCWRTQQVMLERKDWEVQMLEEGGGEEG